MVRPLGPRRFSVDRQRLSNLAADPNKVAAEVKMATRGDGLLVTDVPPGGLAEKAGLRSGDVVKRINGAPVTTPAQAVQAYQRGQSGPSIRLDVERNRRPITLNYELR